jgi:hypothetical protein
MSYSPAEYRDFANHKISHETHRLSDLMRRKNDIVEAQLRNDALEAEEARREQERKDMARCRQHQQKYDEQFQRLGQRAPLPLADEAPPSYRRRMFALGQSMLPRDNGLAAIDPRGLDGSAIIPFESELFGALDREAEHPQNLPDDGSLVERHRTDALGQKFIEFYGKRSFIADLGRRGQKVVGIFGKDGAAVWPPAYRQAGVVKQPFFSR